MPSFNEGARELVAKKSGRETSNKLKQKIVNNQACMLYLFSKKHLYIMIC